MPITTVKIFPSIGIARLGNSPTDWFPGPEIPGDRPPPPGGYKDPACRIKRQAARFRLYGYDQNGALVQEITAADASIRWTVHLANKKASWKQFAGLNPNAGLRNAGVTDRSTLEIDPGPRTLTGPGQAAGFNTGRFLGRLVPLGEMRTDPQGRLLVLGGFGRSESPAGLSIVHYANNNGWYDDTSDGPVTAEVTLNTGTTPTVTSAWVICAPPDFAPPVDSVTTLYDVLFQVAVDKNWLVVPATPSFTSDVWPILQRVLQTQRTSTLAGAGHADFGGTAAAAMTAGRRQGVFGRLRDPNNPGAAGLTNMPKLWSDNLDALFTLTRAQYSILQKWKDGNFAADWPGAPPAPPPLTPDGLTRAALEAAVGGAFFPGIEASWFLRDIGQPGAFDYTEPFRLAHPGHAAGDLTRQMAVPWQADFWKCQAGGGLAWWPAQRPDEVFPEGGGGQQPWARDIVFDHQDMVDHWHKLGFVKETGGTLVETERHKVCTNIFLITDRSTFSDDEVSAALSAASPARFESSLYVVAEGFPPAALGLTPGTSTASYTPAALQAFAPSFTLQHSNGTAVASIGVAAQRVMAEIDPPPAGQLQRFTFVYDVTFTAVNDFVSDLEGLTATATKSAAGTGYTTTGRLWLTKKPNPYMLDGATSWLSTDVRVFRVLAGESPFGPAVGAIGGDAAAALSFINQVVANFRGPSTGIHPFDGISTDPQTSQLELAQQVSGVPAFNFAVARVRYRGTAGAPAVRVFFRLFTVAATGVDYEENSTYRRTPGTSPTALLGIQASKVVTIPCYGSPRVDTASVALSTQPDALNQQDLQPLGGSTEFQGYFGCWLDFNQTTARFPLDVAGNNDGPWPAGQLLSVQQLIRGMHQCLVAEVYFTDDPIPAGVSPATSDNLAQRNLVIVESANPGDPATRRVQHTFELKATRPGAQTVIEGDPIEGERSIRFLPAGPDELMIRWGNTPRTSQLTLYLPGLDADAILKIAGQRYEAQRLQRVDPHTLLCLPGDVSYVPVPQGQSTNVAGLATLELPEGVREGQRYDMSLHQVSGRPRAVLGSFQLTVLVRGKADLLAPEVRKLSVLRHIAQAIPPHDRWYPVFLRYLGQIEDRVRGFGGDPDRVAPSPAGSGRDEAAERCARKGWLLSALLALLVIVAGFHPATGQLFETVVAVAALAAGFAWLRTCSPSRCQMLTALIAGLAMGAGVLGLLFLAGLPPTRGASVLALVGLLLAILFAVGLRLRCFRFTGS